MNVIRLPVEYTLTPEVLPRLAVLSLLFLILYTGLYRRYIVSFFDPLFVFVFTTAFASVLVVEVLKTPPILHFFGCQLCLFAGFAGMQRWDNGSENSLVTNNPVAEALLLRRMLYVFLGVMVVGNLVVYGIRGIPLLNPIPTSAKVAYFKGGFGLVRKINWALGGFLITGLLYLYLLEKKRIYLVGLALAAICLVLEGSKSSLLRFLFAFSLLVYHPRLRTYGRYLAGFQRFVPYAVSALGVVFLAILARENHGFEPALAAFLKRLLYSGDAVLYYYVPVNQAYFALLGPGDYPAYILNPITGFLRLAPYLEAFGNVMLKNILPPGTPPDQYVGPNTPFYIEGRIFFGYYGAFVHSFVLGALASALRRAYFRYRGDSAFGLVFWCYLCQIAAILFIDTRLGVSILFDTCFFVWPVYLGMRLLNNLSV